MSGAAMKLQVSRKQWQFISSDCEEVFFGGAAGGGKSYAIAIDALLYALDHPGSRQIVLRRTLAELKRSLVLTALKLYPQGAAEYLSSQYLWRFANGSLLEFGYCDNEADVAKYQSAEYDRIFFDELTHFTAYQYLCMMSRLRGANDFPKQIKSAGNPGGVGHAWVKERFVQPQTGSEPIVYPAGRRLYIPARIYDNQFLLQADPHYAARLQELPEWERRAFLEGDWDIFAGQFFPEFRIDKHGMQPFVIPPDWHRFVSMDWGYNDPCAVLWHAVCDGHVYTYRELYCREKTAGEVAAEIRRLSAGEEISYYVASPDMWQKRGADSIYGENIADSFAAQGIHLTKADNSRIVGWQRVREYLREAPDGTPYWRFFPAACPNLARTLPQLVFDPQHTEDAAQGEDHAPESLRYGLMSRPQRLDMQPVRQKTQLQRLFSSPEEADGPMLW
ncbi:MAG: phage terminase large subunit [Firmicutes bacterium]|nr:phage terminase large subunit [Bacillota bacterium]